MNSSLRAPQRASTLRDVMHLRIGQAPGQVLPTGFEPLDSLLEGGLRPQELTLLGGRPGVGKTVIGLQWARNLARAGHRALYVCYEHGEATLLGRLLVIELGELTTIENQTKVDRLRRSIRGFTTGATSFEELLEHDPLLRQAHERLACYADNLWLMRASSVHTGVDELERLVVEHDTAGGALFVDYLQKIAVDGELSEHDRVIRLAEDLKELSLTHRIAVMAIAACDRPALTARRTRLHDIRGSAALAYEADVAIMVNEKASAVSKVHLAYDGTRAQSFAERLVFSVEKNRGGPSQLNMDFKKDFANFRLDPIGGYTAETLVDGLLVVE